jgi:beta-lactamase class A
MDCSRNGEPGEWLRFAGAAPRPNLDAYLNFGGFEMRLKLIACLVLIAEAGAAPAVAAAQPPAAQPAAAQPAAASPVLAERAAQVAALLRGEIEPGAVFTPDFLAQVPPAQFAQVTQQLIAANGKVQRLASVEASSPHQGLIRIEFERAIVSMRIAVEAAPPHRVAGLNVTGSEPRGGDSAAALVEELKALPGQVSFAVARLGSGAPAIIAGHEPERALAIGSTFKLIILAELDRQVRERQRRWADVVPIDRHSLPSGLLQDWPLGSPATLHTLAGLMISRSDNTATDVLLRVAGRENVERMMARIGVAAAARNRPFLATMEAFQLKADAPEFRTRWAALDEAARRRLLRERYENGAASVKFDDLFTSGPVAIDSVEWFASSADLVRVADWLRRHGDPTTHGLMAINSGMGPDGAGEFQYVGFKGGSEPGVINLTYLVRNKAGVWHAVTGSWNNPAAAVEEARFAGLMSRAVRLVR